MRINEFKDNYKNLDKKTRIILLGLIMVILFSAILLIIHILMLEDEQRNSLLLLCLLLVILGYLIYMPIRKRGIANSNKLFLIELSKDKEFLAKINEKSTIYDFNDFVKPQTVELLIVTFIITMFILFLLFNLIFTLFENNGRTLGDVVTIIGLLQFTGICGYYFKTLELVKENYTTKETILRLVKKEPKK